MGSLYMLLFMNKSSANQYINIVNQILPSFRNNRRHHTIHHKAIVSIQIKHSVFDCKVHNQKRHEKVGLFRMVTHDMPFPSSCPWSCSSPCCQRLASAFTMPCPLHRLRIILLFAAIYSASVSW